MVPDFRPELEISTACLGHQAPQNPILESEMTSNSQGRDLGDLFSRDIITALGGDVGSQGLSWHLSCIPPGSLPKPTTKQAPDTSPHTTYIHFSSA